MEECTKCELSEYECICHFINAFFKETQTIPEREANPSTTNRCVGCFFSPCRCKNGLENK